MIPTLSNLPKGEWAEPMARRSRPLEAFSKGAEVVGQTSAGDLNTRDWRIDYVDGSVVLSSEGVAPSVLFSRPDITHVSLSFDQSNNPHVAFVQAGQSYFWYFDTVANSYQFMPLNSGAPFTVLDDKREMNRSNSDVLVSYMRGSDLYARVQRERYETEHLLGSVPGTLTAFGARRDLRLQWRFKPNT